jgi:hypothetical protein
MDTNPVPVPAPSPESPHHVNSLNHQFYNIYRRKMALIKKMPTKAKQRVVQNSMSRIPTEQQKRQYARLDLSQTGGKYNPLTTIKPLRPSPLDIYDTQIAAQRQKARGDKTWVMIKPY